MGICEHLKVRRKCQECLAKQKTGAVIAPQEQGQLEEPGGVVSTSLEVVGDVTMTEAGGVGVGV